MSTQHRAFPVDCAGFIAELAPILYRSLETGNVEPLARFIDEHRARLLEPDEWEPLDENWRDQVEPLDAHQLGDLALTAYYDPTSDIGLGTAWEDVFNDLARETDSDTDQLFFGEPFGPPGNEFNPGKLGSFFRSWETVHRQRERLAQVMATDHWSDTVAEFDRMLR